MVPPDNDDPSRGPPSIGEESDKSGVDSQWLIQLEKYDDQIRRKLKKNENRSTSVVLNDSPETDHWSDASGSDDFSVGDPQLSEMLRLLNSRARGGTAMDGSVSTQPPIQSLDRNRDAITSDEFFRRNPIGKRIERFRIDRLIGKGGFGRVFLASDEVLCRDVAIKVVPIGNLNEPRRSVLFEARAAAKLQHPNLVPLFEVTQDDHYQYLISEYCPGPTLSQYLRDEASFNLPDQWLTSIMLSLASAIAYAHRMGLAHRDIKPGNVLLVPTATIDDDELPFAPRLTDFGLVQDISDPVGDQNLVRLAGTIKYMPPEHFEIGKDIDFRRCDIYSLGVVFYQLISGRLPYEADRPKDLVAKIYSQDCPPPTRPHGKTSVDMVAICMKCLNGDPAKRYQSTDDLFSDLIRLKDGREVSVRPRGTLERLTAIASLSPVLSSLLLAFTITLAMAAGMLVQSKTKLIGKHRAMMDVVKLLEKNRIVSERTKLLAIASAQEADIQRLEAQRQQIAAQDAAYRSDLRHALTGLNRGNFAAAGNSLATIGTYARTDQMERFDYRLVSAITYLDCDYIPPLEHKIEELFFVPATRQIGVACNDGTVVFYDRDTAEELTRRRFIENGHLYAATASGDGATIAIGCGRRTAKNTKKEANSIVVFDRETGRTIYSNDYFSTTIDALSLSRDANRIVVAPRYQSLASIDLAEPLRRTYHRSEDRNRQVCMTEDDRIIAIKNGRSVCCWPFAGQERLWEIEHDHDLTIDRIAASRDGRFVLSCFKRPYVLLHSIDPITQSVTPMRLDSEGSILNLVAVSPLGKFAVAGAVTGEVIVWKILENSSDPNGDSEIVAATGVKRQSHNGLLTSLLVDDDGRVYSTSEDQKLCFWSSQERSRLLHQPATSSINATVSTISADGQRMYLGGNDGTIAMKPLPAGEPIQIRSPNHQEVRKMSWSRDGRQLAVADRGGNVTIIIPQQSDPKADDHEPISMSIRLPQTVCDESITDLQFDRDGRRLAVCQGLYVVSILNLPDVDAPDLSQPMTLGNVVKLKRSAHGMVWLNENQILTFGDSIRRWTIGENAEIELGGGTPEVQCVLNDVTRKRILVGVVDGSIRVYDHEGKLCEISDPWPSESPFQSRYQNIALIDISPDQNTIFTGSSTGETAIWDAGKLAFLGTLPFGVPHTAVASAQITKDQNGMLIHWSNICTSKQRIPSDSNPISQTLVIKIQK